MTENFKRIGLELIDLKFDGVDTSPEWRDRLFYLRTGVSPSKVLRMQTVQKIVEELAKSPGAAVGAGIAVITTMFQQPPPPAPGHTFGPHGPLSEARNPESADR